MLHELLLLFLPVYPSLLAVERSFGKKSGIAVLCNLKMNSSRRHLRLLTDPLKVITVMIAVSGCSELTNSMKDRFVSPRRLTQTTRYSVNMLQNPREVVGEINLDVTLISERWTVDSAPPNP